MNKVTHGFAKIDFSGSEPPWNFGSRPHTLAAQHAPAFEFLLRNPQSPDPGRVEILDLRDDVGDELLAVLRLDVARAIRRDPLSHHVGRYLCAYQVRHQRAPLCSIKRCYLIESHHVDGGVETLATAPVTLNVDIRQWANLVHLVNRDRRTEIGALVRLHKGLRHVITTDQRNYRRRASGTLVHVDERGGLSDQRAFLS